MNKGATRLFNKLKSRGYLPKNIYEVGVYKPEESNILGFINDKITTTLVEADPVLANNLKVFFENNKNVNIVEAAAYDFNGTVELCRRASSTFISELKSSPALVNDRYIVNNDDKFSARSIMFSEIDHGNFDLISIDIEGAEWFVMKHMVSRPNIISIETHGKYYTNPYIENIKHWLQQNNYCAWYKDSSDTVFIKKTVFEIPITDKIKIFLTDFAIQTKKIQRIMSNIFKK